MKNNTLSKEQTQQLLRNAYGFVDINGILFLCDNSLIEENSFQLQSTEGDILEYSYDNVTFDNGTVEFETPDADTERFTVLVITVEIP